MGCGKKSHFARDCKSITQRKPSGFINWIKSVRSLKNYKQAKIIKKCTIQHFAFYYNSACTVYKDTKYGAGW